MHKIEVLILEKHDVINRKDTAGDVRACGWQYLSKACKKRVLEKLMEDIELDA